MVPVQLSFNAVKRLESDKFAFRALAEKLSTVIVAHGIESVPYRRIELPHFSALSSDDREQAIAEIQRYLGICKSIVSEGGDLNSSTSFVWRAIRETGLVPPSDLFSNIAPGDIVEIYDLQNIQTFRNFKFFQFCSYTIEDLYTRKWPELFRRLDHGITEKIIHLITRLLAEHDRQIHFTGIGPQLIEEVDSLRRYVNELDVKYLGLLYDRNDVASNIIVIESARKITRA